MNIKLLSEVIRDLEAYLEEFGDMPCFIASNESTKAMVPILSTFVAEVSKDDQEVLASMNVVCIADFPITTTGEST